MINVKCDSASTTENIDDLPTVNEELIHIFDKYGTHKPPKIKRVQPIIGSEKKAIAGTEGSVSETTVGYTGYSSYFNSLVYLVKKSQSNIIRKVPGRGFAISESIIEELKEDNIKYIFGGMRGKNTVLIFPIEKFNNEFYIDGWDEQLYARMDNDVIHEIPQGLSDIFSEFPSQANNAISLDEARNKINS